MKNQLIAAAMAMLLLFNVSGCGIMNFSNGQDKIPITMYLWDKSMAKELTPWLERQFPDIDFTFVVGYNSMDYYRDMNSRGSLPDILTCRRFSLNDTSGLADQLMDLSQTELAGTFYSCYIENNREPDGAIKWLPMCAEVDGYIANKALFEAYDIPLPTNYAEFAEVCRLFEEQGVICYVNDYKTDYSCLESLQGCAIPELMSLEGTMWRAEYENETGGSQVGLDDKVWPAVFEKLEQYLKDTCAGPDDADMNFNTAKSLFLDSKAAMIRGTANDCVNIQQEYGIPCVMLPYYGETADDSWLLTYPMCQAAVNKAVETDPDKKDAVMRVLEAIFSEDGQRRFAAGSAVLSYNKTVNIELSEAFDEVKDCVASNHLYIRLASTEMFSVSLSVVWKMMNGVYDAEGAYKDFNYLLTSAKEAEDAEVILTQNTAYDYAFGEHGSPAVSSVLNTLRVGMGNDIAIGYSNLVSEPVYAGDYTEQQLSWLLAFRVAAGQAQYTGAEIRRIMEWLVNVKDDGSNPIRNKNVIPAVSGMEYTLTDNGDGTYTLGSLTIDGNPLDDDAVYSVLLLGDDNYIEAQIYCNCPMPEDLKAKRVMADYNAIVYLIEALKESGQLEAPSDYVTILH